jgi:ribosomal protein S18 acetylase RimI-like enzyme
MLLNEASIDDLEILTEMNINLRKDEMMDNVMADDEVRGRMKEFLTGNIYKTFILTDEKDLVGYILIDVTKKPCYLRQIYIKETFRSKGYGAHLIEKAMELLNINQIDVEVMIWNEKAVGFYERLGFNKRYLGLRYTKFTGE